MLKWIGAGLILAASGFWGLVKAEGLSRRRAAAGELLYGADKLETEILYGVTPLPPALFRAGASMNLCRSLFMGTAEELDKNDRDSVAEIWKKRTLELLEEDVIDREMAETLICFGESLGNSDCQSQQKLFSLLKNQLRAYEEKTRGLRDKNEKMWKFIGVGAGCALILLLL
jgi:stage III sporulation protein AB